MVRRVGVEIAVTAGVTLLCIAARAEAPPVSGPCAAPLARFCKDVPAGEGRLRACLLAHEQELPADCRARIGSELQTGATSQRATPMGPREVQACREDLETHCARVASGNGRWLGCLWEHQAAISAGCKAAIAPAPDGRTSDAERPPTPTR